MIHNHNFTCRDEEIVGTLKNVIKLVIFQK